jgi:hypothetical protein
MMQIIVELVTENQSQGMAFFAGQIEFLSQNVFTLFWLVVPYLSFGRSSIVSGVPNGVGLRFFSVVGLYDRRRNKNGFDWDAYFESSRR